MSSATAQRPWDARLARKLVTPLKNSRVTPNHLTTVRLGVGLAGAAAGDKKHERNVGLEICSYP